MPRVYKGQTGFLLISDGYTGFKSVHNLQTKHEAINKLISFVEYIQKQSEKVVKEIYMDQGGEFLNKKITTYCEKYGINRKFSPRYTPEANGVSERGNQRSLVLVRSLLKQAALQDKYWPLATRFAVFLNNNTSNSYLDKTPSFNLLKRKFNLKNIYIFGQKIFYLLDKPLNKISERSREGIYAGINEQTSEHIIIDKALKKLY
eukprot:snap_masked-scaffold_16-processed-gene-4.21-mRNA-1 protein AED:1.00 eAED:1.00 QI:0/-1/0/0/-1/1/1/0/203